MQSFYQWSVRAVARSRIVQGVTHSCSYEVNLHLAILSRDRSHRNTAAGIESLQTLLQDFAWIMARYWETLA